MVHNLTDYLMVKLFPSQCIDTRGKASEEVESNPVIKPGMTRRWPGNMSCSVSIIYRSNCFWLYSNICRCNCKRRAYGCVHYVCETLICTFQTSTSCDPYSNNPDKLFHYRITMSPHTNFLVSVGQLYIS
jgi:hypothetical protein